MLAGVPAVTQQPPQQLSEDPAISIGGDTLVKSGQPVPTVPLSQPTTPGALLAMLRSRMQV